MTDFAAIMADAADDVRVQCGSFCLGGSFNTPDAIALVLAAKVIELCPGCWLAADVSVAGRTDWSCGHIEAPTIGKLLAIGAAVMTGVRDFDVRLTASDRDLQHFDGYEIHQNDGKLELLAELRAVAA